MTVLTFENASEVLNRRQETPKLTTGNADLDSLLGGGIEPGQFYLFYGDEESGVDYLIHQILVNCLLPVERFGFGGKCIYSNCGNYREDRVMFDSKLLCFLIKAAGLEPVKALERIYAICCFSQEEEEQVFNEVQHLLDQDRDIRLLVVHNLTRFFTANQQMQTHNTGERISSLQKVVFGLWKVCSENNLALVASCRPTQKSVCSIVPRPEGGKYLSHKATAIVYLDRKRRNTVSAHLVKHPNRAPKKIDLISKAGGDSLGRITMPFRNLLQDEIANVKRTFREALMDGARRDAFDSLVNVWSKEQGAMSYARVPTALDTMLLAAAVDNRKVIEALADQLEATNSRLAKIEEKLKTLSD